MSHTITKLQPAKAKDKYNKISKELESETSCTVLIWFCNF